MSLLEFNPAEASFWSNSLMAILNNVAPQVIGLARATSSKLVSTFARMAKPSYFLANETNLVLLSSLMEAINSIVENHGEGHENDNLLYAVWRARHRYETLRRLSLADEDVLATAGAQPSASSPTQSSPDATTGITSSEKARGKQPFVQNNIPPEVAHKLLDLPLHTPLTLIQYLNDHLLSQTGDHESTATSAEGSRRSSITSTRTTDLSPSEVLRSVHDSTSTGIQRHKPVLDPFKFQAPIAALYASFYWGLVVSSDVRRASDSGRGIWVGTNVKLFRIKAGQVQGPSLWSPKGAVDAVGESLVAGVRDLTLRARKGLGGEGA